MRTLLFILLLFFCTKTYSNSFSEIFGKEGESGILNPKTRSLSYAFQYLSITGTTGYFIKQLHDNAFFEPLGFTPTELLSSSPLAYGKSNILDVHEANIIGVNQKVEYMNYVNNLKDEYLLNKFSPKSIEFRNNSNLLLSQDNTLKREKLLMRYTND